MCLTEKTRLNLLVRGYRVETIQYTSHLRIYKPLYVTAKFPALREQIGANQTKEDVWLIVYYIFLDELLASTFFSRNLIAFIGNNERF